LAALEATAGLAAAALLLAVAGVRPLDGARRFGPCRASAFSFVSSGRFGRAALIGLLGATRLRWIELLSYRFQ